MTKIVGKAVKLSKGRKVFVGRSENIRDTDYYVEFTNKKSVPDERVTKMRLTPEAFDALCHLKSAIDNERRLESMLSNLAWRVTQFVASKS